MAIVITDNTALSFWRWWNDIRPIYINPIASRMRELPKVSHLVSDIVAVCEEFHVEKPYEVLVRDSNLHRKTKFVKYRNCSMELPNGSLCRIHKDLYVVSPEFLFLRMAKSSTIIELITLGFELTGTYVNRESIGSGFQTCKNPLTSTAKITRYLSKANRIGGLSKAKRAVRWILDDSASPRETELACLLTLPMSLGGYALPTPSLNHSIQAEKEKLSALNRQAVIVDIAWPDKRLAIEYDSTQWHSNEEKLTQDSIRRNVINQLGFEVITITNAEFNSIMSMDRIVDDVKKRMRIRSSYCPDDFFSRKLKLRQELNRIHFSK